MRDHSDPGYPGSFFRKFHGTTHSPTGWRRERRGLPRHAGVVQTTTTQTVGTELVNGPFATNGRVRTVTVTFTRRHTWIATTLGLTGFVAGACQDTARIDVYRKVGNGAESLWQVLSVTGSLNINNEADGSDVDTSTWGCIVHGEGHKPQLRNHAVPRGHLWVYLPRRDIHLWRVPAADHHAEPIDDLGRELKQPITLAGRPGQLCRGQSQQDRHMPQKFIDQTTIQPDGRTAAPTGCRMRCYVMAWRYFASASA